MTIKRYKFSQGVLYNADTNEYAPQDRMYVDAEHLDAESSRIGMYENIIKILLAKLKEPE